MTETRHICPARSDEHCLFGVRQAEAEAEALADETSVEHRRRALAGLAMTEREWALRYAGSSR